MLLMTLSCVVALSLAIPCPNFPVSWTANEQDSLAVIQGPSVTDPSGYICCDPKTNCEVQTEYQAGINRYDGQNNRTRFDGGGQIIVTLYDIGKEMLVDSNLACQEYCPTEFDFDLTPFWPDDPADQKGIVNLGNVTINGLVCTHYQWLEKIAHLVKMQQTDLYVYYNKSSGYAVPIKQHDIIEPFGQPLGTEDSEWEAFTPGTPDASLFAVTGIQGCPESQNCDSNTYQQQRLRNADFRGFLKHYQNKK